MKDVVKCMSKLEFFTLKRRRHPDGYCVELRTPQGVFKTAGFGFDMVGSVLGSWLNKVCETDDLQTVMKKAAEPESEFAFCVHEYDGQYRVNGMAGVDTVILLAREFGILIRRAYRYDGKGKPNGLSGFMVYNGAEDGNQSL